MFKCKTTLQLIITIYFVCFTNAFGTVHDDLEDETAPDCALTPKELTKFNKVFGTKISEFPFVVFLYRRLVYANRLQICGGTIISETWVLTSATCLIGRTVAGQVIAGSANRNNYKMKNVRRVIGTVVHPDFDPVMYYNNIGLVEVRARFCWNEYIQPVMLAKENMDLSSKMPGNVVVWGQARGEEVSTVLAMEKVSILARKDCTNNSQIICSLNEKNGPCEEDSGYPLLIGRSLQIGIVSHELHRCGEENTFTKYTNVAYFRKWIQQIADV